mmetsp:Transcript_36318/g.78315  ORF Transcript_36318/g.78315 Transcript_36318/m.78315 type:complete len:259 (-) Transcript_36318:500-1276(-)
MGLHAFSILANRRQLLFQLMLHLHGHSRQRSTKILFLSQEALDIFTNGRCDTSASFLVLQLHLIEQILLQLVKELGWWNNEAEIDQSGTTHSGRRVLQNHLQLVEVFCFRKSKNAVHLTNEVGWRCATPRVVHVQRIGIVLDLFNDFVYRSELQHALEVAGAQNLIFQDWTAIEGTTRVILLIVHVLFELALAAMFLFMVFPLSCLFFALFGGSFAAFASSLTELALGIGLLGIVKMTSGRLLLCRLLLLLHHGHLRL